MEGAVIKTEHIEIEIKLEPCPEETWNNQPQGENRKNFIHKTTTTENTDIKIANNLSRDVKNTENPQNKFDPVIGDVSQQLDFTNIPHSSQSKCITNPAEFLKQTLTEINEIDIQNQSVQSIGHVYENGSKNRVQCNQCEKTFKNRAGVKKHIKYVHDNNQPVECKECLRSFKSILYLRSHIRSVHAKYELLKCPHCEKVCNTNKKLKDHIYITHKKDEDKVDCSICGKEFKSSYHLKLHVKYVHPDGQSHTCHICQKSFKVDMLLQRHIKWAHPDDGMVYKCQVCNKILSSLDGYKTHMKSVHFYHKVTCDLCKLSFKSKHTLERHLANIHYGKSDKKNKTLSPKQFKCQFCDRSFVNSTSLYWHIDRFHSHNQQLPHNVCVICNRELSDYAGLHRHLQSMHSIETATCKICSKEFKSPINLQNHIRITHAPPEAVQTCHVCQKTFKCNLHLRMHILSVHDGGTYTCHICQKIFTSNRYLTKHLKSHNDARDYKCDICSKMYKNIHSVNKHKKLVHDRIKCDICNLKQKDIVEHMRNEHPDVEYANDSVTTNEKPKRQRNPNKNKTTNIIENTPVNSLLDININENSPTDIGLNENLQSTSIKIEVVNEITCDICNQTFDSPDFDEHKLYCRKPPILEVVVKNEIKEEIT